ncbi:MAG: 1-acyl-sn-glycerol-3-phosphate acyltransferase [Deltaproteobacteria bacterium]|nr:1-acyl-sn-glycerol-3-phosphate acyltransferase [Deltaproteobacteria bacterium]
MDVLDRATGYRQLAECVGLCLWHHVFKLGANVIDPAGDLEQQIGRLLARRILEHFGCPVRVAGLEHLAGLTRYGIASTHASFLDWAVLLGHFPAPLRFVAKRELVHVPVIGDYLRLRGILIDRSKGEDAKAAITRAAREDLPWPILIFPEGTRSFDGRIGRFKPGGLRLLVEAGRTIVPVRILGTYEALSRHDRSLRPRSLELLIGEAVPPGFGGGVEATLAEVERRVRGLGVGG